MALSEYAKSRVASRSGLSPLHDLSQITVGQVICRVFENTVFEAKVLDITEAKITARFIVDGPRNGDFDRKTGHHLLPNGEIDEEVEDYLLNYPYEDGLAVATIRSDPEHRILVHTIENVHPIIPLDRRRR